MASVWIRRRVTSAGETRFRVEFRVGGRESRVQYAGSFRTLREANARRGYVAGELAGLRVPDLKALERVAVTPTVREAAERWRASRVDVADSTRVLHRVALGRVLPHLGSRQVDEIEPADVAELVATLVAAGYKRETISKSITALAQVLDYAGCTPNPARDRVHVRLPRESRPEINPPTAEHVRAVCELLPTRYRLPLLVLDGTGMRLGELEALTWGDMDESRSRWRVSQTVSKTRRARWVQVSPPLFAAVLELVPRDDRVSARPVFQGFGADRFRTAITRACRAAGVPTFSPHDLRHRRIKPAAPERRPLGADRRARRPAQSRRDGERLQPRAHR